MVGSGASLLRRKVRGVVDDANGKTASRKCSMKDLASAAYTNRQPVVKEERIIQYHFSPVLIQKQFFIFAVS